MNKLSVVVPAFNEEQNLRRGSLNKLWDYLNAQDYDFELIVVDDGSSDKTLERLNNFKKDYKHVQIIANQHEGKAGTVKTGMLSATGDWRLYTDFDQSTPINEIEKLYKFEDEGYQVMIGSRELDDSIRDKEPWYRHIMGRVFNWVVRFFTVKGIYDTQCGFKLFSAEATETLFPKLKVTISKSRVPFTGAFDVELLYLAQKNGYKIVEVPVHWQHYETERVSPIKDSMKMFIQVVKIWWTNLSGKYEN